MKAKVSFERVLRETKKELGIDIHLTERNTNGYWNSASYWHSLHDLKALEKWTDFFVRFVTNCRDYMGLQHNCVNISHVRQAFLNSFICSGQITLRDLCLEAWKTIIINKMDVG